MEILDYLEQKYNIKLNSSQQGAVLSTQSNTLLLAVPGSGKTTVLVSRIANLIINHNAKSSEMLTLTYSRETAKDMHERYSYLFGGLMYTTPEFKTIHSFCFSVLSYYAKKLNREIPQLISDNKTGLSKQRIFRKIYQRINSEYLTDDSLETLDSMISYSKNMMHNTEQMSILEKEMPSFVKIFEEYESFKKSNKLMDYDDMLCLTHEIFTKLPKIHSYFANKYKYINIDEAQDTSLVQHKIIKLLSDKSFVFMVGDEDQSIYSFRGAYPKALLNFKDDYKDAIIMKMEQNYRSNKDIVEKANEFIKQNKQRYEKEMFCESESTNSVEIIKLTDYSKQYEKTVELIERLPKEKTIAIIYRNNESAIPIIDLFYKKNLSFYIKEHKLTYFSSFVVRDIVAFLLLAFDLKDINSFKQIYYKMGISKLGFEYVDRNLKYHQSVFMCASSIPSLYDGKKNKMIFHHSAFKRMAEMNPTSAIKHILNTLGYMDYINRMNDGFTKTNAFQKINTAIQISQGIETIGEFLDKLNEMQTMINERKKIDKSSNITLTTLHSSKGLEFDVVIMLDMIKEIIPTSDAVNSQLFGKLDDIENENRLFYVGATRAKSRLIFYKSNTFFGATSYPSRYIDRFINGAIKIQPYESSASIQKTPRPKVIDAPNITGKGINHLYFGLGVVIGQSGDNITVNFKGYGEKTISYSFCVDGDILKINE